MEHFFLSLFLSSGEARISQLLNDCWALIISIEFHFVKLFKNKVLGVAASLF